MFEIGILALIVLCVVAVRQHKRLNRIEGELAVLRKSVGVGSPAAKVSTEARIASGEAEGNVAAGGAAPILTESHLSEDEADVAPDTDEPAQTVPGPWAVARDAAKPAEPVTETRRKNPDIETALGTRWAVWVGGVALAFGGLFLVRYSIESGLLGPGVRLTLAAIFGVFLAGAGEFIRRTGFKVPIQGVAGAYIPAILTAAGAFTLFGAVYAAHGIYGFIGPAFAFFLLGLVGVATIAAALVHGQALAGLGLLGSLATPLLVASQSPKPWALFGYLAIVLAATAAIARIRDWKFLAASGFVGTGLWTVLYMVNAPAANFPVVLFIDAVTLLVLSFIWLARRDEGVEPAEAIDWPSLAPALFVAYSAFILSVHPAYAANGAWPAAIVIAALVATAVYRRGALPLLHAAGAVTVLIYLLQMPFASLSFDFSGFYHTFEGIRRVTADAPMGRIGVVLSALFLAAGFWTSRRYAASAPVRAASWTAWGVAVPLVVLLSLWTTYGNLDRDLFYAAITALLVVAFAAGGEWIARVEQPPLRGGPAVSFALSGAGIAALVMLHMAFGSGLTTVLLGASAVLPALATRWRGYPVLGWLSAGALVAVLCRVSYDTTIVGAEFLSKTPVFNWLLLGYGVPSLAFGFCAWQLARSTNGRPRLVMEAGAALFALLTVAMLVRHSMHGGVIDDSAATLAEQAIYTLIALGFAAILIGIDMRSPSSVLRYGSLGLGVVSVLFIVGQHFGALNPLFTDESTGRIPVFNLLLLAYLLPAIAAGTLALYARGKRPRWYSAMLALVAALLVFAYATLSVRRLFKGEFIGLWNGLGQWETYSYSALWLVMGVVLLTLGVRLKSQVLRIASAALISVSVLKVFLFDMSELEGVLRALSFIGLGGVLIGIGLFYQRLLTRAARVEKAEVGEPRTS
ncbi:DUF2339 domain-containing protein [Mesorhizobium sp. A556]